MGWLPGRYIWWGPFDLQPLLLPSTSSSIRIAQDLPPQLREARRGAAGQVQQEVDLPLGLDYEPGPRYKTPLRVSSPVYLCDCGGVGNGSRLARSLAAVVWVAVRERLFKVGGGTRRWTTGNESAKGEMLCRELELSDDVLK